VIWRAIPLLAVGVLAVLRVPFWLLLPRGVYERLWARPTFCRWGLHLWVSPAAMVEKCVCCRKEVLVGP
jgi:hypothetical protein